MEKLNLRLEKSPLFLGAQQSRLKLNILFIILVYFLLWLAGLFLGRALASSVLGSFDFINQNESAAFAWNKIIVCGTQILVFFVWVKFIEKRPVYSIGFQAEEPLKSYSFGLLTGLASITAIAVILMLTGAVSLQKQSSIAPGDLAVIALGWVIQSASEEIAIRGWLIPCLGSRSNPIAAVCITAVLFGALHLFNSGVTILSFVNLTLSGMLFAFYAIASGNIWGVCGLHFAWNFALGNLYGFPVSGFSSNGQTVFAMRQMDFNLLTGGAFGPEGGFVTTIILLAVLGIFVFCKTRLRNTDS